MNAGGRNRNARYRLALGETNECIAILDLAEVREYVQVDATAVDRLQHVRATLLKLTR